MKTNLFEMGAKFENELDDETIILEISKHNLKLAIEKRKGKIVTVVGEFFLHKKELEKLSKELKSSLASGGAIKERNLEFQGDVKEKLKLFLEKKGFVVV